MSWFSIAKTGASLAVTAASWLWKNRELLGSLAAKYSKPGVGPAIKFDGAELTKAIIEYEPIVFDIVKNGASVTSAVIKVVAKKLGVHKMTPEEEKIWMERANQSSGH